jgi:N-acetylneuraminic acid mutarotase
MSYTLFAFLTTQNQGVPLMRFASLCVPRFAGSRLHSGSDLRPKLHLAVVALACLFGVHAHAQTNEWTWWSGNETIPTSCPALAESYHCANPGVYGSEGQPAQTNAPGGRTDGHAWTDSQGNLWLFGGFGTDSSGAVGDLNDLWEFNLTSKEWVWQGGPDKLPTQCSPNPTGPFCGGLGTYGPKGVFADGNLPSGRDSAARWTDRNGNFWLFGGEGFDSSGNFSWLNDLWEFNPNLKQWAWWGGGGSTGEICQSWLGSSQKLCVQPSTPGSPGGRQYSTAWTDRQGNFWLFGGLEVDSSGNFCSLDDLWEFSPVTGQWALRSGATAGSSFKAVPAVYGAPGAPQAGQTPGGRWQGVAWTDTSGNLWLFGGVNSFLIFDNENVTLLNDVWEFNPQSNQWAWMSGNPGGEANFGSNGSEANYGELGTPAITNIPGGRGTEATWTDLKGNFWLSGGFGQSISPTTQGGLNDLWVFSPSADEWTWMGGGENAYTPQNAPPGVYGTVGVPAPNNLPGTREFPTSWTDNKGNFWLLGGEGIDSSGNLGYLNDLWEYAPPSVPAPVPGFMFYASGTGNTTTYPTGSVDYTFYSITGGGFNSPISLSASGLPNNATAIFNPNPINGDGKLQLDVALGANSPGGDYLITVTGTGGGTTQTAANSLLVQPPFFVEPAAATLDVQLGTQGTMGVSVGMEDGFSAPVTLAASGLPNGVSISFAPDSVTASQQSTMTVSIASGVTAGTYGPVIITGTANGVTEQSQFSVNVTTTPPPSFTLAVSPASLTAPPNSQAIATLTVTPQNGFTGQVTLSCSCSAIPPQDSYSLGELVNVSASAVTTQFTIYNFASSAAMRVGNNSLLAGTMLPLASCFFVWKKRKRRWIGLLILFAAGSLGIVSSCGGGGSGGGGGGGGGGATNPTTFNVTVTATSGAIQQSTVISVTLN